MEVEQEETIIDTKPAANLKEVGHKNYDNSNKK